MILKPITTSFNKPAISDKGFVRVDINDVTSSVSVNDLIVIEWFSQILEMKVNSINTGYTLKHEELEIFTEYSVYDIHGELVNVYTVIK